MKTITELSIEMREETLKAEIDFWRKTHPNAKVELKDGVIHITVPLPKDYSSLLKIIENSGE